LKSSNSFEHHKSSSKWLVKEDLEQEAVLLAQLWLLQDQLLLLPDNKPDPPPLQHIHLHRLRLLQHRFKLKVRPLGSWLKWPALLRKSPFDFMSMIKKLTVLYSGVAIGSSVGHAIGNMFGGSSAAAAPVEQAQVATQSQDQSQSTSWGPRGCEADAKSFTKCLDENQGNMQICGWYLEQLVRLLFISYLPSSLLIQFTHTESLSIRSQSILNKRTLKLSTLAVSLYIVK
jgi:hypothetical protein